MNMIKRLIVRKKNILEFIDIIQDWAVSNLRRETPGSIIEAHVSYNARIFDVQSASVIGILRIAPSRFRLFIEYLNAVVTPNRLM